MKTNRLIIVAVGGQGNLLASRVLGEAALAAGVPVRMSEIHGMAQRGGVVESAILFGQGRSTLISDGEADVLVGFEPAETLRALPKCSTATTVITNLAPLPPFTVAIGRGTYPDLDQLKQLIREKAGCLIAFDATAAAKSAGNVMAVNMVLLGALCRTDLVPVPADAVKSAIDHHTKEAFRDINLDAFARGYEAAGDPANIG